MFWFFFLKVAMLDPSELSILFTVDGASGTNSPVVSLGIYSVAASAAKADQSKKESPQNAKLPRDVLLSLTKDARVTVLDCTTGAMINSHIIHQKQSSAISMYVIGK
jgi:syntaxin-binding protein 5